MLTVDHTESLIPTDKQFFVLLSNRKKYGVNTLVRRNCPVSLSYPVVISSLGPQTIVGILLEMEVTVTFIMVKAEEVRALVWITDDKISCVYIAPDKQMIEEHAKQSGFPADCVSEVKTMIDPTTAQR